MKVLALLSAFTGLFFGIICFFILQLFFPEDAFLISAAAAIGYYIVLFLFLMLYDRNMKTRYKQAEKHISSPILFKATCQIHSRGACVYICENKMVLISLDKKPYVMEELLFENIISISYNQFQLNILANDDRLYMIKTSEIAKIVELLDEKCK